ncbi:hypothetical protein J0895_00250 [Phormidium pseudopriestleyi FRX01]|uniref:Uncharacterized protein n=1 Tax=Phormidium pseudopriestleyi FRX01 TaxID=1759528 RepID=A0ABS3FKJ2_9CYAN|nr:hypothetical protein [Phormidium pseudopriestleyi FRX01]
MSANKFHESLEVPCLDSVQRSAQFLPDRPSYHWFFLLSSGDGAIAFFLLLSPCGKLVENFTNFFITHD